MIGYIWLFIQQLIQISKTYELDSYLLQYSALAARTPQGSFNLRASYFNHSYKLNLKMIRCKHCERSYPTQEKLDLHFEEKHSSYRNKCEKQFASRSVLNGHMRNLHSNKIWKCEDCGEHFKCEIYLKRHVSSMLQATCKLFHILR